jgi:hypothetical protein
MRYRQLAFGAFAAGIAACMIPACGGSDEDAVITIKKDSGTGGKDSGTGGKDAGKDSSTGGSAGAAGSSGASGGGGTSGAAGGGGAAGSSGAAGSAGSGGTKPDSGTGGTDAGKCEDNAPNEPNNTEAAASAASAPVCGAAAKEQSGVIAGSDVDWYDYGGNGTITCATAPTVEVDHPSLRACVFVECNGAGTTTVTCAQGATATSPDGLKGCCASGGNEAETTVACSNLLDKSIDVHMRVDQSPASPAACFAYKLAYSL